MSEDQAVKDIKFDPINMGQALGVLADVVASYVTSMKAPPGSSEETERKLSQVAVAIFLHNLLMRSLHKEEMAGILDAIAFELRDAAKPKEETKQ